MYYLIEDPTYPLTILALAALVCLVTLQVTQQGKFLIWAVGLLGVGGVLFLVERLVVTEAERVEAVVYELADAVSHSNVEAVEKLLAPEIMLGRRDQTDGIAPVRTLLPLLRQIRFDFVKVRQLTTQAGTQTKRGSAEFKVSVSGVLAPGSQFMTEQPFAAANTEWSLGFREVSPQVWQVTRITAITLPRYAAPFLSGDGTPGPRRGGGGGGRGPRR